MSEPMTVVEIEDVLSSIRRLVSEDLRPTHKLVTAALRKNESALILTPALRVVSEAEDTDQLPDDDLASGGDTDSSDQPMLLENRADGIADQAAIVPVFGSVRHVDASEAVFRASQNAPDQRSDGDLLANAMSRFTVLADPRDEAKVDGSAPDGIEAVVAAVGAAVGPQEWEVDGGEPAPQSEVWEEDVWLAFDLDAAPQTTDDAGDLADTAVDDQSNDTGSIDPSWQQHDAHDGAAQADDDAHLWAAGPTADAASARQADAASVLPEQDDLLDDSAGFLSEDLLREIVRDMVRYELQGSLGERITRNVRKLVRAEINRALASRDYQ